jgi:hypothetical protein
MVQRCADRNSGSRKSHASQAEFKMILQKSARSNFGFLKAAHRRSRCNAGAAARPEVRL